MPLDTRIPLMAQPVQLPDFNALAQQRAETAKNNFMMQRMQRQDQAEQNAMMRRQQVGSLAAQGNVKGAQQSALEGGDFELFDTLSKLDETQRKAAKGRTDAIASVALAVKDLPYEQRRAAIASAAPYLANAGVSEEEVVGFDPTDQNIGALVSSAQTVAETFARMDKDRSFKLDTDKFGETVRSNKSREYLTQRGQDVSASTARRGQDISASTAIRGQNITLRGQDLTNAREVRKTAQGKPLTESQGKAQTFARRMVEANKNLVGLENSGTRNTGIVRNTIGGTLGLTPIIGDKLESATGAVFNAAPRILGGLNEKQQQTEQARRDFVNAVLRRESGASISPGEFDNAQKQYFPQIGDSDAVLRQKQRNRETAIEGMRREAGPAAADIPPTRAAARRKGVDYSNPLLAN